MSQGKTAVVEKIGTFASILCLIHCLGLAILTPLIPVLGVLAHNEWIEILFWGVALATALWQIFQTCGWLRIVFIGASITGTVGLAIDEHLLLHLGFAGIALGQIVLLQRRKAAHTCSHDH